MESPPKIKNRTTTRSNNSTSGYISDENENTNSKRYMHSHVHCRGIYNSQDMKTTFIYKMEYYSAIKKNGNLPFAITWMDLEGIMLREISQTEKDKYHMILLICGLLKKKKVFIDTEKRLIVARGGR